jgi:hypothetical protein
MQYDMGFFFQMTTTLQLKVFPCNLFCKSYEFQNYGIHILAKLEICNTPFENPKTFFCHFDVAFTTNHEIYCNIL